MTKKVQTPFENLKEHLKLLQLAIHTKFDHLPEEMQRTLCDELTHFVDTCVHKTCTALVADVSQLFIEHPRWLIALIIISIISEHCRSCAISLINAAISSISASCKS